MATASHFTAVGNAAPPRPSSLASFSSLITACGPDGNRPPQHLVSACRPVGVERARVDLPHPPQQPERGAVIRGLRDERAGRLAPGSAGASAGRTCAGSKGASPTRAGSAPACWIIAAEPRSHWPRHGLRCQVTPAPLDAASASLGPEPALHLLAHLLRAVHPAGEVVADVDDRGRRRAGAEQGVERRHPVRLGRRDGEPGADVVERPGADPADPFLHRVQHRQQQVPPGPRRVAAERGVPVGRRALPAFPAGLRRPEHRGDGGPLLVGGRRRGPEPQVH